MAGYTAVWPGLFSAQIPRFRKGTKAIADAIPGATHHPTDSGYDGWREMADEITALHNAGTLPRPLCLVGHSNGGYAILKIAERLKGRNIDVDALFIIDRAFRICPRAGSNVKLLYDFWAGLSKAVKGNDFNGEYQLFDLDEHAGRNVGHVEASSYPLTFNTIVNKVAELTDGGSQPMPVPPHASWYNKNFKRKEFFDAIRPHFPNGKLTQGQVDGMEGLLSAWEGLCPEFHMGELAYNLGTARHETANTMQPIKEYGDDNYFFKMYDINGDRPHVAQQLGNDMPGDGVKYPGRGHVQCTGKSNYRRAQNELINRFGIPNQLVENPDEMLDLLPSSICLFIGNHDGWWTGRRLPNYAGYGHWDMKEARTVVNGHDKWQTIGGYAEQFLEALRVSAYDAVEEPTEPPTIPPTQPPEPSEPPPAPPQTNPEIDSGAILAELDEIRASCDLIESEIVKVTDPDYYNGNLPAVIVEGPETKKESKKMLSLLNMIPGNGGKTITGIIAYIALLWIDRTGAINFDPGTFETLKELAAGWAGLGAVHKVDKLIDAFKGGK